MTVPVVELGSVVLENRPNNFIGGKETETGESQIKFGSKVSLG